MAISKRRRLSVSIEEDPPSPIGDDGLEVTKAIEVVNALNNANAADDVATAVTGITQQEKNTEEISDDLDSDIQTDGEIPVEDTDLPNPDGSDIDSDTSAVSGDDELEGLGQAASAATALEALIVKLESGQVVTTESFKSAGLKVSTEADTSTIISAAKNALKAVWDKLIQIVTGVYEFVSSLIDIHTTKLKTAKNDITVLEEAVSKLNKTTPRKDKIENETMAALLVSSTTDGSVAEMLKDIKSVTTIVGSYFEHLRQHFMPFTRSLEQSINGLNGTGANIKLMIGRMTLPSVMKRVNDIPGKRKPDPDLESWMGPIMTKGLQFAGFTSQDNTLTGNQQDRNSVVHNALFITRDPDWDTSVYELDVMNHAQLKQYLSSLDDLRAVASQGEVQLMLYRRSIEALKKLILKHKKDVDVLEASGKEDELKEVIRGRREIGNLLNYCLITTERFYGKPNREVMEYTNAVLSAGIAYCTQVIKAYTYKDNPASSEAT